MSKVVERWECSACNDGSYPCRVEVEFTNSKLPEHLQKRDRFILKRCLCGETNFPDWKRTVDQNTPNGAPL